ncbi:MAG TPA: C40 family peptidase [Deltaproteobacteria bacterium]|nr:C40 family peptidase [Deltaproteobacteria bacterium]
MASAKESATVAKHARELYDPWLFRNAPEQFRAVTGESGIDDLTLRILESAYSYLGTPYRFGGTTPAGFDCSGFVRQVFTENGISLSRSSREQAHEGVQVPLSELKPGDLIFFNMNARNKRRIDHVGIYIGNGQFIHASSGRSREITIDALESGVYLHRVVGARRVLADSGFDEAVID